MTIPTRDPFGARLSTADRYLMNSFSLLKLSVDTSKEESIRKMMSAVKFRGGSGCVSAKQINKACNSLLRLEQPSTSEEDIKIVMAKLIQLSA